MALGKWFSAEVTNIIDETENTKRFFFKVPELEVFNFKAGQFITFDLPIHEKKNRRWRSYSMASPPNGSNEFELVIVYVPQGSATNYLWSKVRIGSTIPFKGPAGNFILPDVIDTDLCFIATGTGIAPFRSMLYDEINHPRATRNINLIFGTRYLKDILYRQEIEAIHHQLPQFKFIPALSREYSPDYSGHKGYVHAVYEKLFSDKRPANYYLCGWRNMVDEAKVRIAAMGYNKKDIHVELYG
ncbi:MAG: oxidoreductase [Chitinophagales bacterium]|nr:oxidoreductase [Chitinophagales bacterium]